jgi:hypothetical protein
MSHQQTNYGSIGIKMTISILWNSQNSVVCLTVRILKQCHRQDNFRTLGNLYQTLWQKEEDEFKFKMTRRHLTAIVGMATSGVATFGLGAVGSKEYTKPILYSGS